MILPAIVFSQFAGTSLWFAGNAVLADLQIAGGAQGVQWLTQAVQFGFICGTLLFAALAVADRFSPRLVFLLCCLAGATTNFAIVYMIDHIAGLIVLRFATGFFLAGVYPVGMKIAAGWYERGLGGALGLLVGALVLGTAFPHLVHALGATTSGPEHARRVLSVVSGLAAFGGVFLFLCVPDGPHLPRSRTKFVLSGISKTFRRAACGYFGHMWELYAFWAFTPLFLQHLAESHSVADFDVARWSFMIIAAGFVGCALGGWFSVRFGSARVAWSQLLISGTLCFFSPLLFWPAVPFPVALGVLVLWGVTVVGDSPQFSALVAATAPRELVGSALTIVNSLGFTITIFSIQLTGWWLANFDPVWMFVLLAPGPLFGLLNLFGILRDESHDPARI